MGIFANLRSQGLVAMLAGVSLFAATGMAADAPLKPANKKADSPITDPLLDCVIGCRSASADGLRNCSATHLSDEKIAGASRATTNPVPVADASVASCLSDGLDNVGTCLELFGDGSDPEGFWGCVGGAVSVFLRCTGVAGVTNSDMQRQIINKFGIDLLILAAEKPEPQPQIRGLRTSTKRIGPNPKHGTPRESNSEQTEGQVAGLAQVSFGDCAAAYKENRQTCKNLFLNDPEALEVCLAGTTTVFNNCISGIAQ